MMRPILAACLLTTSLALVAPAAAAPAMWQVSDDDSSIFLFGSFHILPPGTEWRSQLFDRTLAEADAVVFETDIGPEAQADIGAKGFLRGMYVDGTLLTDVMDDTLEARLREEVAAVGVPMGTILAMRPWMAANIISGAALTLEGYTDQGVEITLDPEIDAARKVFLETGDQQLDVLAGAPEDEQIAMLESTLDQLPTLPKIMDKMVHHWLNGTPDRLANLFLGEVGGFESAFMDRLIYNRNRNWIAPLEAMLADDRQALVVVGAAHLIGEDSVVDLLGKAGYRVERVQ